MKKKITLIGTDSTHCYAFAKLLNSSNSDWEIKYAIRDYRSELPISVSRREKIEKEMSNNFDIQVFDFLTEEILTSTDAFIIASVDANLHVSQFKKIAQYKKPIFIDKPITYSSKDAKEIDKISKEQNAPYFSSSSLRFSESIVGSSEFVFGKSNWNLTVEGPLTFERGIPGMFWYGIHIVEALLTIVPEDFTIDNIQINKEKNIIEIYLISKEKRAVLIGDLTGTSSFRGHIYSNNKELLFDVENDNMPLYQYLLTEIIAFFETQQSPVNFIETSRVLTLVEKINKELFERFD
jgi:hypothetical protein